MRLPKFAAIVVLTLLLVPAVRAEVNLVTYGGDPTGATDSGPALQSALNALGTTNGTVLFIPKGTYKIATGVTRNFSNSPSSIILRGEGSASMLRITVGGSTRAIQLQNLDSVLIENVTFVGSTTNGSAVDALYTIDLDYCQQATIRRCDFYGVTTVRSGSGAPAGAVVYANHSDLRIENSSFHSCAGSYTIGTTPFDGTPVVDIDDWVGLTVSDTDFIDWGTLNGVGYTGATWPGSSAWVRLRSPASRSANAVLGQGHVVFRRVRMDEGAYYGIAIKSGTSEKPASVQITGLMLNGFNNAVTDQGTGVYVDAADNIRIEKSWFGWSQYADKFAIDLNNVPNAVIDGVVCDSAKRMRKIRAAGTTNLTVRDSSYASISSANALSVGQNEQMAMAVPIRSLAGSTTIASDAADQVILVTAAGTITIPPAAGLNGRSFTIKNESTGSVAVTSSSGTIDGVTTKTITTTHGTITVVSNGTAWYIVMQLGTII